MRSATHEAPERGKNPEELVDNAALRRRLRTGPRHACRRPFARSCSCARWKACRRARRRACSASRRIPSRRACIARGWSFSASSRTGRDSRSRRGPAPPGAGRPEESHRGPAGRAGTMMSRAARVPRTSGRDCRAQLAELFAYLDGELSDARCRVIERHLASCACCEGLADGLRARSRSAARRDANGCRLASGRALRPASRVCSPPPVSSRVRAGRVRAVERTPWGLLSRPSSSARDPPDSRRHAS